MERGLVKFFITPSGKAYIYDAVTSRIITLKMPREQKALTEEYCTLLYSVLKEKAVVSEESFSGVCWSKSLEEYKSAAFSRVPRLLLEITKKCNLKCDYCVVSGKGCSLMDKNDMSEETLMKALDMFLSLNKESKETAVDFYGGEAFIRFDLIKKAVKYIKENVKDKTLSFGISTNGLLLNKDVARWLSENPEVVFTCTVNGPYHDMYRKTHSGNGSLKRITENLEFIKENYPAVWEKQARFIANVNTEEEKIPLLEYYQQRIGKIPVGITKVNWTGIDNAPCISDSKVNVYKDFDFSKNSFTSEYLKNYLWSIHNRTVKEGDSKAYINSCFPGEVKIFVRCDGSIGFCEQGCDKSVIGNTETGIDEKVLEKIYSEAQELYGKKCKYCWAQRLCENCLARFISEDGSLLRKIPESFCKKSKEKLTRDLILYCSMVESVPEMFENKSRKYCLGE